MASSPLIHQLRSESKAAFVRARVRYGSALSLQQIARTTFKAGTVLSK